MKRLIAFTLSAFLLCPITSFAAQTEEAQAVYQEMMNRSQTTNDINAYYDMNLTMWDPSSQETDTDSVEMRIEMNARMQNLTNPAQMRYQIFSRISMPEQQPIEYSMYYMDGYTYMDMLGQKIKYPMPLEEAMNSAMSASTMLGSDTSFFQDLTLRTEGDNRILSYTMDDSKINEYMTTFLSSAGTNLLPDSMNFTISNIRGEYIVTPDGYFTKAYINMDMGLTMMDETIHVSVACDIGIADPGQPVTVNMPNPQEYTEQPLH